MMICLGGRKPLNSFTGETVKNRKLYFMKNFFLKNQVQIKLILTILFGVLAFIKWQSYKQTNSKSDLVGFVIFCFAFVVNVFDVRYFSKKETDSRKLVNILQRKLRK